MSPSYLKELVQELTNDTTLVAVSKTFPATEIERVYAEGMRHFGENRVSDLLDKMEILKDLSINWHFVGHLQTNKVKKLMGKLHLLHSLDSEKLYRTIVNEGGKTGLKMPCLLQINISKEPQKSGIHPEELGSFIELLKKEASEACPVKGLMCIGSSPQSVGIEGVEQEFREMKSLFDSLKKEETDLFQMRHLSMGMSQDYKLAMECGSNMVRLGTIIFGNREYSNG
jgi:pyridoxal phosphate enzyme (YggS family)